MKTILVVREFDAFSRVLAENDFEIINLPLIETSAAEDLSDFEAKLENAETYDGIFLTSKNSALILVGKLRERNISFSGKVYVLGKTSFKILQNENLNLVFSESANTAREMLENIEPQDLKNKNFLFVRGEKSLRTIPEFTSDFAKMDEAVVYKTQTISLERNRKNFIREKIEKGEISAACFFSPSGAESFIEQFGADILHQTFIAAIGTTTAEFIERQNLKVGFISPKASAEDFAVELIEYLKEKD